MIEAAVRGLGERAKQYAGRATGWIVVVLCIALVVGSCSSDTKSSEPDGSVSTSVASRRPVPNGAPPEVSQYPGDWVLPGRDYDNSRSTTDSAITKDNVTKFDVAWEATVSGPLTTTPLVVGDTIYVQDGTGKMYALDRANGKERWSEAGAGFNIGPFGVAVADGRVYGLHGSKGVVARDAKSGSQVWVREFTGPLTGIDIQPLVYDSTVLASTVPVSAGNIYAGGARGVIHALDAKTGKDRWTFDTVGSDDLWGNAEVNSGGGAWYPPAVDTDHNVVYWGIANPAPFPGTAEYPNGSSRPGPNLYTDSVVTLGLKDGALQWYHQVHEHDLFDRDLVHTLVARDKDGQPTVIGTGKGGVVVGLDPVTGTQRWRTSVGVHDNDTLTKLDGPTKIAPGTYGGVLTPPATASGVVYLATVDSPVELKPNETAYFGAQMGQNDGELTAVDASDGKVMWSVDVPGDPLGGATVVNDLVFTATVQGAILAYDRTNGDLVWKQDAPGGINGWMTAAGDLLVIPVGNAQPPRLVAYRVPSAS